MRCSSTSPPMREITSLNVHSHKDSCDTLNSPGLYTLSNIHIPPQPFYASSRFPGGEGDFLILGQGGMMGASSERSSNQSGRGPLMPELLFASPPQCRRPLAKQPANDFGARRFASVAPATRNTLPASPRPCFGVLLLTAARKSMVETVFSFLKNGKKFFPIYYVNRFNQWTTQGSIRVIPLLRSRRRSELGSSMA